MVLPTDITIKVEKEDFEHETILNTCEIEVKIEKVHSPEIDWCVDNEQIFANFQECYGDTSEVVDYEELTEYGLQICSICKQMFQDIYSLLCHKLTHVEVRMTPIQLNNLCNYCPKYFNDEVSLRYHIEHECENVDSNQAEQDSRSKKVDSMQRCRICCKEFTYKIWFDHMKRVHSNQCYQCELCDRKFKAKVYLKRHIMFVHEGQQRVKLVEKMKPNTNVELLKCHQCPAVFPHKTPLHLHIKNCHCEKVRCDKCSSVLKKSYLANHMRRVHYNDGKEHKCECGKKFRSPRYLKIHIKNSHSKPKPLRKIAKRETRQWPVIENCSDIKVEVDLQL